MYRQSSEPIRTHTDPPLIWSWLDGENKGTPVWKGGAEFCDDVCVDDAGVDVMDKCSADQKCVACSGACGLVGDCSAMTCVFDCDQCLKGGYYEGGDDRPVRDGQCARDCGWMRSGGAVDGAYVPWSDVVMTGICENLDYGGYKACHLMVRTSATAMRVDTLGKWARKWVPVDRLAEDRNQIFLPDDRSCDDDASDCRIFWTTLLNVVVEFEEGYSGAVEWDACGVAGLCDCFSRKVSVHQSIPHQHSVCV
jgi:hypothetical protein